MKSSLSIRRHGLQLGVTILEFIAFIGLAALVIVGALMLYDNGSNGAITKEFTTGLNSVALSARQLASGVNGADAATVAAASITGPTAWRPASAGNGWVFDGATIVFANNGDGTFNLQVSGLRNSKLAQLLVGKRIFDTPGAINGDTGVDWNRIKFQ